MKKMKQMLAAGMLFLSSISLTKAQETMILNPISVPMADTSWIFLPKEYQTTSKKFPVVFMLHGWSANYKQWNSIINCQKYCDAYDFILVCPDGFNDSWYINSPTKPLSKYADFFFQSLLPKIKEKYTKIDDKNVFITGLSMGGFGALHLFLQNMSVFKGAGSTSGLMDLRTEAGNYGLSKMIGDPNSQFENWKKLSLLENTKELASSQKEIIFDCGTEDKFYGGNNLFRKKCDESQVRATYIAQPGKHDKAYWKKSIKAHFDFFKRLTENQ